MSKVENRINELKAWLTENIQREKKMEKIEQSIKDTWEIFKRSNIHVIRVSLEEERRQNRQSWKK